MEKDGRRDERLVRRLRYLWRSELLFSWLLWQGAAYWWLKLRAEKTDSQIPEKALRWFAALKHVNWALIGSAPFLLIIQARAGNRFRSTLDAVAGLYFYLTALLEQVNYYHWQLMYDYPPDLRDLLRKRRLKRSSLNRAIQKLEDRGRYEADDRDER